MKETDTSAELNRYRQAADVAYRYAKTKLEQQKATSSSKEEDAFDPDKNQES